MTTLWNTAREAIVGGRIECEVGDAVSHCAYLAQSHARQLMIADHMLILIGALAAFACLVLWRLDRARHA